MFKLPQFILSQTSEESCPFTADIVIDYSLVQTEKFVTRNIAVKERRNWRWPKDPISYRKAEWVPKWNRIWRSISVQYTLQYFDRGPFWLWQDLFYRIFIFASLLPRFIIAMGCDKIDFKTWATRVMQRKLFPNESDDDEDAEEEVEASVCYSESATWFL